MERNPSWSRDELILALDLYMRIDVSRSSGNSKEVVELSDVLNDLPIHPQSNKQVDFRNSNGVYMKLCNFLRFDDDYKGAGLQRGSKLDEEIWNEFAHDIIKLSNTATAIISGSLSVSRPFDEAEVRTDEVEEFVEGRILTKLHNRRERNLLAVKRKKERVFKKNGKLECEVCGFDFFKTYGHIGQGFAECHHRKPISELTDGETISSDDLAIVCANCHRILHRVRPWKTVEELREIYSSRQR